jgi:hypothetical protein
MFMNVVSFFPLHDQVPSKPAVDDTFKASDYYFDTMARRVREPTSLSTHVHAGVREAPPGTATGHVYGAAG